MSSLRSLIKEGRFYLQPGESPSFYSYLNGFLRSPSVISVNIQSVWGDLWNPALGLSESAMRFEGIPKAIPPHSVMWLEACLYDRPNRTRCGWIVHRWTGVEIEQRRFGPSDTEIYGAMNVLTTPHRTSRPHGTNVSNGGSKILNCMNHPETHVVTPDNGPRDHRESTEERRRRREGEK